MEERILEKSQTPNRTWTKEEKERVWDVCERAKKEGKPLTEAFRHLATLLPERSEAGIGMLYYSVLRKERSEKGPSEKKLPNPTRREALEGLPEALANLNRRIDQLEEGPDLMRILEGFTRMAKEWGEKDKAQDGVPLEVLKEKEEENKALKEQVEKLERAYQDALAIYELFTNMAAISQIMSLSDFKQQLKNNLDEWRQLLC